MWSIGLIACYLVLFLRKLHAAHVNNYPYWSKAAHFDHRDVQRHETYFVVYRLVSEGVVVYCAIRH